MSVASVVVFIALLPVVIVGGALFGIINAVLTGARYVLKQGHDPIA